MDDPTETDRGPAADYRRLLKPPPDSFSVFGLRGAGKMTWVRTAFPGARVVDLGDEGAYQKFLVDPSELAQELQAALPRQVLIVRDIQRAPALLTEVRRAMETGTHRFVVLGSNVCPLRSAASLLTTHLPPLTLYPLVPAELGRDFALDRVLRFGSLPAIWEAPDPQEALVAFVQEYVREEIRGAATVRNLPAFLRFLPAAAIAHGRVVNVAALARDAAASRATIDGYLAVLRDTLMATLLPAFEPRLRVRERRHPKLYWTDPGVVRAVKRQLGEVAAEERGPLLEGLALTVLRAHNRRGDVFDDIGYWAPGQAHATEVDVLLRRGREYLAIDIATSTRHARSLLAGLRAIAGLPRLARRVLVYLGDRPLRTEEGIDVWPLPHWLDAVASGRLWP